MENTDKLLTNKQYRVIILMTAIIVFFSGSQMVMATDNDGWSCGAWTTDANDSCKEVQTCTRTVCDTGGDSISNCRTETKTSTATKANCPAPVETPKAGIFDNDAISPGTMAPLPSISPPRIKPVTDKLVSPTSTGNIPEAIPVSPSNLSSQEVPSIKEPAASATESEETNASALSNIMNAMNSTAGNAIQNVR